MNEKMGPKTNKQGQLKGSCILILKIIAFHYLVTQRYVIFQQKNIFCHFFK